MRMVRMRMTVAIIPKMATTMMATIYASNMSAVEPPRARGLLTILAMLGPLLLLSSRGRNLSVGMPNTSAANDEWSKTGTGILHDTGIVGGH